MRWSSLFEDLEAQLDRERAAEDAEIEREEERLRVARLTLLDRIEAAGEEPVTLRLATLGTLALRVSATGPDWVSGDLVPPVRGRSAAVVSIPAVRALVLSEAPSSGSGSGSAGKRRMGATLSIASVLRELARRRAAVEVVRHDGAVTGTIDRVGRDHLDLALHERDEWRRRDRVRGLEVIPFAALVAVLL